MKWVTRRDIRMDRAACGWLIKRHIDPRGEIMFVEAADIADAVEDGAFPFHNTTSEDPNSRERTSFQELLAEYKLDENDEALALMGDIVRGAETKEPGSVEEGEGLRAIAKGMKALSKSDEAMVTNMLPVFDALYMYCQRRLAGKSNWATVEDSQGSKPRSAQSNGK